MRELKARIAEVEVSPHVMRASNNTGAEGCDGRGGGAAGAGRGDSKRHASQRGATTQQLHCVMVTQPIGAEVNAKTIYVHGAKPGVISHLRISLF